jgi:hypothetical protein
MFNMIKPAAKRIAATSMSVLAFYDNLNSQLEAMKQKGLENNPNWVTMWDRLYQAD